MVLISDDHASPICNVLLLLHLAPLLHHLLHPQVRCLLWNCTNDQGNNCYCEYYSQLHWLTDWVENNDGHRTENNEALETARVTLRNRKIKMHVKAIFKAARDKQSRWLHHPLNFNALVLQGLHRTRSVNVCRQMVNGSSCYLTLLNAFVCW